MRRKIRLIIAFVSFMLIQNTVFAQEKFRTEPKYNQIETLLVRNSRDWKLPAIIPLNGDEFITVGFDEMSLTYRTLYFDVIHCNADWTPSNLSEMDYLDGFNRNLIKNVSTSFNTRADYTHYTLSVPNNDLKLKISGNYMVKVYDEDANQTLITACFSVVEPEVSIEGKLRYDTDVSIRQNHQQVEFAINNPRYPISNAPSEIKVSVQQNQRIDNEAFGFTPTYVLGNQIIYEHKKELVFEAGNEYRRFEMVTTQVPGMGIEKLRYNPPYFQATLLPSFIDRPTYGYSFAQDLDGRAYIRYDNGDNSEIEADYVMVHFDLPIKEELPLGDLYVMGEFTCNKFNNFSRMLYNSSTKSYQKAILMKQGVYDYAFVFVPKDETKATLQYTEGNYYETENEYLIKVYHRPLGGRYDKLIGFSVLSSIK